MPTMTVLVDGSIPVAEDFNGNFRRLNQAIGTSTGITTLTTGDLLYASATDTLTRRAIGSTGDVLTVTAGLPAWASPGTASGTWGQRNLVGTVTTTTIAVSAYAVTLRNSTFGMKVHENTGTLTLDSAASGLNGRDQVAAFSAGQTLHAYWISDGTNLRTVLADAAPVTGPDLTTVAAFSGYTYWAYIGPFIWNGSSNFIPARIRGTTLYYEAQQSVLADGRQTNETAVDCAAALPATALVGVARIRCRSFGSGKLTLRVVSGADFWASPDVGDATYAWQLEFPNVAQQLFYLYQADPGATLGVYVDIQGYRMANGGE